MVAQDVFDEPTSALDIAHEVDVLALVHRLEVVLHDVLWRHATVRGWCEMIAQGTPAEIMRGETLEMIYGIPMGILPHPANSPHLSLFIDLPLISRRRLLTAMALSPLLWQMNTAHAAAIDPNRIVALEWLPVELLLALGIVPYGVADTINYRLWVSEPPLPDSVIDVGLRTEPNLELLTEMKPSFMVWSAGYGPSPEMLARIAPGRGFTSQRWQTKPLAMARKSLTEMAGFT